jgi:hypothetical protein
MADALECPPAQTIVLANLQTRLKRAGPDDAGTADQLGVRDLRYGDADVGVAQRSKVE